MFISFSGFATVNLQTGVYSLNIHDFTGMERHYRGDETHSGIMGKKWMTVYDTRLKFKEDTNILYMFDGAISRYHIFEKNISGNWQAKTGTFSETDSGYQYNYKDRIYKFNDKGLLTEFHKNAYVWFKISYDKDEHISRLTTYEGIDYLVETNTDGMIIKLRPSETSIAVVEISYSYNDGYLHTVKDVTGVNNYKYDENNLLTYASFVSKPPIYIDYVKFESDKYVSKVSHRDTYEKYNFKKIVRNDRENHFTVDIEEGMKGKKDVYKIRHEFNEVYKNGKYQYTKRVRRYRNDYMFFEQVNNSNGLKQSLFRQGVTTKYMYGSNNKVIRQETPDYITTYTYNEADDITYFSLQVIDNSKPEIWSRFSYNNEGELILAENSEGKILSIQHDSNGNIISLRTDDKLLHFTYNDHGMYEKITVEGVGSIKITYDIHGDMSKNISDRDDYEVAKKITEVVSEMMTILGKSGISI